MSDQPITTAYSSSHQPTFPNGLGQPDGGAVRIGACEVHSNTRTLFRAGRRVDIGGRAFELLIVLLHARGTVVTKEQILRDVWPTTVVEESNLRFQMVALRKALGEDHTMIKTVHGRGYMLVAESRPVHVFPSAPPGLTLSREGVVHQQGSSLILVVEHGRDIRDALFQLLRPIDAEVFAR